MKAKNTIIGGIIITTGLGVYYLYSKNKKVKPLVVDTTSKAEDLYAPESSVTSIVNVPASANVLTTASAVVQSSVIQEEDINSLDCATLKIKYDNIIAEITDLAVTTGSNPSQLNLLKNRKALIETAMVNKNCKISDPILENAVIQPTIIPTTKYTNQEISEKTDSLMQDLSEKLYIWGVSSCQTENCGTTFLESNSKIALGKQFILRTKLSDFLKTLKTKEEVNRFSTLYPNLMQLIMEFNYLPQRQTYRNQRFTSSDIQFLNSINYNDNLIWI